MKTKSLGRGMEEISHIFLSSEPATVSRKKSQETRKIEKPAADNSLRMTPSIGITGSTDRWIGTFALVNISIELARQGYRVLVIDEDPGPLNVMRSMGLIDVENPGEMILHNAPMGVRIAYRTPFLNDLALYSRLTRDEKNFSWPERYRRFDFILSHLPQRNYEDFGPFLRRTSLCIAIGSTEPEGMLQTYAAIKGLNQAARQMNFGLIVYDSVGVIPPEEAFIKMARNVRRFLHKDLISYSFIRDDAEIAESMETGMPLSLQSPSSEVRRQLFSIAGLIIDDYDKKTS
ncbi:MAG: MinD/ParA family protein [Deltaproteobacteria bacterium]|nr:MinD/ParA family protein [Deltaproteobacteria bacterium]